MDRGLSRRVFCVSRTIFLAAIALAVLLMQLLPNQAHIFKWIAMGLAVMYLFGRGLSTYPRLFREKKRRAAQQRADEQEYQQYQIDLASIRARHDPQHEPLGRSELSQEFSDELTALHEKYQAMLERKFGSGNRVAAPGQQNPTNNAG
jgi:hypothetical protein